MAQIREATDLHLPSQWLDWEAHPNHHHSPEEMLELARLIDAHPDLFADFVGEVYRHWGCSFSQTFNALAKIQWPRLLNWLFVRIWKSTSCGQDVDSLLARYNLLVNANKSDSQKAMTFTIPDVRLA